MHVSTNQDDLRSTLQHESRAITRTMMLVYIMFRMQLPVEQKEKRLFWHFRCLLFIVDPTLNPVTFVVVRPPSWNKEFRRLDIKSGRDRTLDDKKGDKIDRTNMLGRREPSSLQINESLHYNSSLVACWWWWRRRRWRWW
jgi:hypothetical protein